MTLDESICERVESSLKRAMPIRDFQCIEATGEIPVQGKVDSVADLNRVPTIVRLVPGVRKLVNKIQYERKTDNTA